MTSRERILAALNFTEADRVPIDFGGLDCTAICIDEYCDLLKEIGVQAIPKVVDQFDMVAGMDEAVMKRLGCDAVMLDRPNMSFNLRNENWKLWKTFRGNTVYMPGNFNPREDASGDLWLDDENGVPLAHMPKGGLYFDMAIGTAFREDFIKMTPEEWKASNPLFTDEDLKIIGRNAKLLREGTDKAVCGMFNGVRLGTVARPFAGMSPTEFMVTLMLEEDYMAELFEATAERGIENLALYLQAVNDNIDVIQMSTMDYGTQRCELFNPEIFHRLCTPNHKKANDYVHTHSKAKTFIHTCGSVFNIIPYIIEGGFDILNPVQLSANNMDPVKIKENFGGKIVFWGGGVSTQQTLPFGTAEDVVNEVKRNIDIFAPGGGFVFAAEHCVQYGVPIKNLLAAVDTVQSYGKYPIGE